MHNSINEEEHFEIKPDTKIIIIVEGKNDRDFFECYLEHLIKNKIITENLIQIAKTDGNKKLKQTLNTLQLAPNFDNITEVLIIFDSDNSYDETFTRIESQTNNFMPKPKIILMPAFDNSKSGTLEDLCLDILKTKEKEKYLNISDKAVSEAEQVSNDKYNSKKRFYTYFSIQDKYVETQMKKIATLNAFNFNAPELTPLKELLQKLSTENKQNNKTPVTA
ncbi:MAG: hypothetical protein LBM93_12655 [Oscillospiraceae bacterium]|jgi:hypothetical protein|nr:hypothetical protein [Oscillospiraceae bacterium]